MSKNELPHGDIDSIVAMVVGTVDGFERAMLAYNVETEELEEMLLDENIERCEGCDWYVEAGELSDDDGDMYLCVSCREIPDTADSRRAED